MRRCERKRKRTHLTQAENGRHHGRTHILGEPRREIVKEHDEHAEVFANAQYGKHRFEGDDDLCFKVWRFGGLERLVVAEEHEDVGRKATEAKVKVAGFVYGILLCEGVAEHVDLV